MIKHLVKMIQGNIENALDVGCGTGLSSVPLLSIAKHVYATDISPEMLKLAAEKSRIRYSVAPAEKQPFENSCFDLITVGSAVAWFDVPLFLTETARLLRPNGSLVIYSNYGLKEKDNNTAFEEWLSKVFKKKFPPPPGSLFEWTIDNLSPVWLEQ